MVLNRRSSDSMMKQTTPQGPSASNIKAFTKSVMKTAGLKTAVWKMALPALVSALLLALSGCPDKGQLDLKLDIPSNSDLNPLTNAALREFRIQVHRGEDIEVQAALWNGATQSLEIGELDPGAVDALVLAGYSNDGRLLAYGRTGSFQVPDGNQIALSLPFRRPLTYVSGLNGALQVFDTSLKNEKQILDPLQVVPEAQSPEATFTAATTPDGRYLLTLTHKPPLLTVVDTRTHTVTRSHVLDLEPSYLGISPDSRWVVASDPGAEGIRDGTVMIMDLNRVINDPNFSPVKITGLGDYRPEGRPAFTTLNNGQERVVLVGKRANFYFDCTEEPSVLQFADPYSGEMDVPMPLSGPARSVASFPKSPYLFVAMPCQGAVLVVDPDTKTIQNTLAVESPMSLAMSSPFESTPYLFVGNATEASGFEPAKLSVTRINLTNYIMGTDEVSFYNESILLEDLQDGTKVTLTMEPQKIRIWRMSLPPGQQKLSLLAYTVYSHGNIASYGLNAKSITTDTYVTLDLNSGELGGRYRANCYIEGLDTDGGCLELPQGQQPQQPFLPFGLTTIYGSQ